MRVKICGVKTIEAATVAVQKGAAFLGLVFYPPSPRYLSIETAQQIAKAVSELPLEQRPKLVGVFVNVPTAEMLEIAEAVPLDYLQLGGDETPEMCREAAKFRPVLKSLRLPGGISESEALNLVEPFGTLDNVTLLLDTPKQGFYGGTGEVGNWQNARAICQHYPTLLAGGLTSENVAHAVELVQPWGVDVSSGVEVTGKAGEKDLEKIKQFLAEAQK